MTLAAIAASVFINQLSNSVSLTAAVGALCEKNGRCFQSIDTAAIFFRIGHRFAAEIGQYDV